MDGGGRWMTEDDGGRQTTEDDGRWTTAPQLRWVQHWGLGDAEGRENGVAGLSVQDVA